jgi:hypothetical protein
MRLAQLFTPEELEMLDERQLVHLQNAVEHEIRSSPEIRDILSKKFGPVRDRMAARGRSPGARGSTSRRSPGTTTP